MAKTILLVDDEKDTASVFETALKSAGYNVVLAQNGKAAFDTAVKGGIDGILLDQMMPEMNGNETLKVLKADDITKNIPVSMLSNFGDEKFVKEAIDNGASDYIFKYQVSPEDLVVKVKRLVGDE